jgi:hypothetical protein
MIVTPSRIRFTAAAAPQLRVRTLVTFPSYEDRFLASLERAADALNLAEIILIVFCDYVEEAACGSEVDPEAVKAYRRNYAEAQRRLADRGIACQERPIALDDLPAFISVVKGISWGATALDITTMPRSYILTALRFAVPAIDSIVYTQGRNRREGEDAFTIGVRDIVTLPGFEGRVGHRPTLLVMSVGYEGARAYSLFRRFEPTLTIATLGDPGPVDDEQEQLLRTVKRNNGPLFDTDGVWACSLPSYDPGGYTDLLLNQIDIAVQRLQRLQGFPADVVLSPVGTKPQTLGLFSIWSQRPEYQIAYAVPTMRRVGTVDAGNTYWFLRRPE